MRFQRSGWAWPKEFYVEAMKPMKLINENVGDDIERNGHSLSVQVLTFERVE